MRVLQPKVKKSVTIDAELWRRVERLARGERRSRSAMLEGLVREALEAREAEGEGG